MKNAFTHLLVFSLSLQAFGYVEPPPIPCPASLLAAAHSPTQNVLGQNLGQVVSGRRQAALEELSLIVEKLEKGKTEFPKTIYSVESSVEETLSPSQRGFLIGRLRRTFSFSENDARSTAWLFETGEEIDALVSGLICLAQKEDDKASFNPACASFAGQLLIGGATLGAFIAAKSAQYSVMLGSFPNPWGDLLGIPRPEPDYSKQNEILFWSAVAFGAGALIWALSRFYYPQPTEAWPAFADAVSKKMRKAVEASEDPRFFSVTAEGREMDLLFWVKEVNGQRTPRMLLLTR